MTHDILELGSLASSTTLRRFWSMLAHWHGQRWNGSEFGRAFGISHTTVRRYLDALTSVFAVRQLPPWHENIAKRQVRSPKIYVGDSGILHAEAPQLTRSMRSALETLNLEHLDVIHAGTERYMLAPNGRALPAANLTTALKPLRGQGHA